MALKFSMILEASDRASAPAKRAQASMGRLTGAATRFAAQVRRQSRDVQSGARSLEHYARRARRLRSVALGRVFQAGAASARRMAAQVDRLAGKLRLAERAGKAAKGGMSWLGGKAMGLAKWGLAAGAAAGGFALYDMFNDAGKAEIAREELAAFLGSAEAARREFDRLKSSNFGVPIGELLTEYVALRKAGIEPTSKAIRTIADEARTSKKSFGDMVQLLKEARGGDFGSIEGIGIKVAHKKGVLALTYLDKQGKRVSRSVRNSADEIEEALLDIFNARSGGASARYQRTWFGLIDGIKNRWNRFQLMVADAGIFDKVKGKTEEWMNRLEAMAKDGRLQAWAKSVSDKLEQAFDWGVAFAERTDWEAVGRGLATAISALAEIVELLGQAASKFEQFQAFRAARIRENVENGWLTSDEAKAKARDERRAIERRYGVQTETGRKEVSDRADRLVDQIRKSVMGKPQASNSVGGEIRIGVDVRGPGTARVQSVRADNKAVPISVRTGKTMQAAA